MTPAQTKTLLTAMATEARDLNAQHIRCTGQSFPTAQVIESILVAGIAGLNKMINDDAHEP